MPMIWSAFAIPVHISAKVIFSLRARRVDYQDQDDSPEPRRGPSKFPNVLVSNPVAWLKVFATGLYKFLRNPTPTLSRWGSVYWNIILREFWLHREQRSDEKIHIQLFQESRLFIICAWFMSVMVIFHIILGTLVLSSTTFIGPKDALGILARYVLLAITCCVILVYELAVIRVCYEKGQESNHEHGLLKADSKLKGGRSSSTDC
jgi:hypothetical protein